MAGPRSGFVADEGPASRISTGSRVASWRLASHLPTRTTSRAPVAATAYRRHRYRVGEEGFAHDTVGDSHLASDPTQERTAEGDDHGEAVHQAQDEAASQTMMGTLIRMPKTTRAMSPLAAQQQSHCRGSTTSARTTVRMAPRRLSLAARLA